MSSDGSCPNDMSSGGLCPNNICPVVKWIQLSLYMFINEALVNPCLLNSETILK